MSAGEPPGRRTSRSPPAAIAAVALASWLVAAATAGAQTLEPRAYVSSPIGANLVVFGIARSSGGVLVDPSLPIQDIKADARVASIGLGRTFALFGRQASVYGVLPYAWGTVSGKIGEAAAQTSRSGLADAVFRFGLLLAGGRAMAPQEFIKAKRRTIVGASLSIAPPLGQYYPAKLINLGTNRWSVRPEIGVSHPIGKWLLDAYSGVWLFTTNAHFYPGTAVKTASPIGYLQAHVSYSLTLRAWAALDATWYNGGRSSLNGVAKADLQNNARMGVTLSLPVGRRYSVKAAYSWDVTTTAGTGFKTISASWQMAWFDRRAVQ